MCVLIRGLTYPPPPHTHISIPIPIPIPIPYPPLLRYGSLAYWLVGLKPSGEHFAVFLGVLYQVIAVGFSWSQLCGSLVRSLSVAIALFMCILVYSLLLGGFIVSKQGLSSSIGGWIVESSYFWQGYEALMTNEFSGTKEGDAMLASMGMFSSDRPVNILVLACMFVVLRLLSLLALRYRRYEVR